MNNTSPRKRGDSAKFVYEHLRKSIINLELAPGELLDESSLSARFLMSRSPIREALIRLSMEGLVHTLPNKNSVVAPLDLESLPDYLDAIELIQRLITRLAAQFRTEDDLIEMRSKQAEFRNALAQADFAEMIESNREFHMAISKAARNKYFDFLHSRLLDDGRRMLHLYFNSFSEGVPESVVSEHDAIIDAIESQNANRAETLAKDHVVGVAERFLNYLNDRHSTEFDIRVKPRNLED